MPVSLYCTPVTLGALIHAMKSLTNFVFSCDLIDMKYVQQPRWPTRSLAGRPRNSSSEMENETTGQFSEVKPALANSLKNGTLVSPFSVLITQALPPAANFLMAATIVW